MVLAMHMPLLFCLTCKDQGTQRTSRVVQAQCITRPKDEQPNP